MGERERKGGGREGERVGETKREEGKVKENKKGEEKKRQNQNSKGS